MSAISSAAKLATLQEFTVEELVLELQSRGYFVEIKGTGSNGLTSTTNSAETNRVYDVLKAIGKFFNM